MAEEINELRTAKDLLLSQIVELKNDKEGLSANLVIETEKNQARVAALEIKLQDCKLNGEKVKQELEKEKSLHLETQQSSLSKIDILEKTVEETNVKLNTYSEEVIQMKSNISDCERERDEVLSKNLELEAGVASALEERRGLLERYQSKTFTLISELFRSAREMRGCRG